MHGLNVIGEVIYHIGKQEDIHLREVLLGINYMRARKLLPFPPITSHAS